MKIASSCEDGTFMRNSVYFCLDEEETDIAWKGVRVHEGGYLLNIGKDGASGEEFWKVTR